MSKYRKTIEYFQQQKNQQKKFQKKIQKKKIQKIQKKKNRRRPPIKEAGRGR